jgi:6-phosphogluconolactonase
VEAEIVVAEAHALAEAFARRLEEAARQAFASGRPFSLALPGGSAATALFPRLVSVALDWTRVLFFWADERAVPPSDPESNYGLARALWLGPAGVPAARIHRMRGEAGDLERAAEQYEAELRAALGDPPRLDLALLGVGPDGHVASLFPGHRLLKEAARRVAALDDAPKPPPGRLTLTLPMLAGARLAVVAAFGRAKAEPVRQALADPGSDLPVAVLARRAPETLFLLDPEAAAALPPALRR